MKENVSGYSRNPCSLNRERDAAFAAKLLTLPTGFFSAEKSEEWMARSPVWPEYVIASETASRHQPMNWRDSIWAQTRSRGRRSRCVKLATQRLVPYSENKGYASNPRRFRFKRITFATVTPIVYTTPVAQLVEHGVSNAKIVGSIPKESKSW